MSKLYALTDIEATIGLDGVSVSDIESMSLTLSGPGGVVSFSSDAGEITIDGSSVVLIIGRDKIVTPGSYAVRISFTDNHGKIRGLEPAPEYLKFY